MNTTRKKLAIVTTVFGYPKQCPHRINVNFEDHRCLYGVSFYQICDLPDYNPCNDKHNFPSNCPLEWEDENKEKKLKISDILANIRLIEDDIHHLYNDIRNLAYTEEEDLL